MAKSKNIKGIISIVCLVLSVMLIVAFFMPTFVVGEDDNKLSLSAVQILEAKGLSDKELAEETAESVNPFEEEDDREESLKLVTARAYLDNEDVTAFNTAVVFSVIMLIAGIAGVIISVFTLIKNTKFISLICYGVIAVLSVIYLIVASNAGAQVEALKFTLLQVPAVGAGVIVSLICAILMLVATLVAMFVKTPSKKKK